MKPTWVVVHELGSKDLNERYRELTMEFVNRFGSRSKRKQAKMRRTLNMYRAEIHNRQPIVEA